MNTGKWLKELQSNLHEIKANKTNMENHNTHNVTLSNITSLTIFFIGCEFWQFTVKLHFLLIFSILAKFQDDKKSTTMSSNKFLKFKYL